MTRYVIPIDKLPNQSFDIELEEKRCRFDFITKGVFLYMNLVIDEVEKLNGIICLNNVDLIQYKDIDFNGRLYFLDTQGDLDPIYYGLGTRWLLFYDDGLV